MVLDNAIFPQTDLLRESFPIIREELLNVFQRHYQSVGRHFILWPEEGTYSRAWNLFPLFNGYLEEETQPVADNCSQVPQTTKILQSIPGLHNAGFSVLESGTYIRPHWGDDPSIRRIHLGLIVPPKCAIRVKGETYHWQEGEVFCFDDTSVHEAWNYSGEARVILLIDVRASALDLDTETGDQRSSKEKLQGKCQVIRRHFYHRSGIRPSGLVGLPHKISHKLLGL